MMIMQRLVTLTCAIVCLFAPPAAAFDETLRVMSLNLTEEEFLRGEASPGSTVTLSGALTGPDVEGKLPVVILLHGTDGPGSGAVWSWTRVLDQMGVATFGLDSYTARGFGEASTDQSRFNQFAQIYDTYRAVEVLAAHPKLDGSRVVVMGFSRGGTTALYSAMTRFQKAFGPREGRIVAHLPFYPSCNFELEHQLDVAPAPIREFHGVNDDWTPVAPCRAYIDKLAQAGHDAKMTVYPNALHGFDSPKNPARYSDSTWQTSRNCLRREENGRLLNAATGRSFTYRDACVEYGPSVQYNDAAATAAQSAVKALLIDLIKGK